MSEVQSHVFGGRKYVIDTEPFVGWCDTAKKRPLAIRFPSGLGYTREDLDTAIHESLHACFPSVGEKKIEQSAEDISRFLWRMGYRRKQR